MKAETTVDLDGEAYALAFPLGAFEEVATINPYLRRVVADLQGAECNYKLARQVTDIALRYGGGGKTSEDVYAKHGWGAFQELALAALVCGFAEDDQGNADAAAETETSHSE